MKTADMIGALDNAINRHVGPFMASQRVRHTKGLSNFDGYPGPSSIKERHPSQVASGLFWWINRFETARTTFDIGYGDREALVETMLYYRDIPDRFAPWELLEAAKLPDKLAVTGEMWVLDPDFMERVIRRIGEGVSLHWGLLSAPSNEIIDRARVLRGKRIMFAQEEQRRVDRERACIKASAAFHEGNTGEAVRLLEPFEQDDGFSRSSRMMLEMARKRM